MNPTERYCSLLQAWLLQGRSSHWETGGDYDAAWRIVDNIPHRELWAEIRVHR